MERRQRTREASTFRDPRTWRYTQGTSVPVSLRRGNGQRTRRTILGRCREGPGRPGSARGIPITATRQHGQRHLITTPYDTHVTTPHAPTFTLTLEHTRTHMPRNPPRCRPGCPATDPPPTRHRTMKHLLTAPCACGHGQCGQAPPSRPTSLPSMPSMPLSVGRLCCRVLAALPSPSHSPPRTFRPCAGLPAACISLIGPRTLSSFRPAKVHWSTQLWERLARVPRT